MPLCSSWIMVCEGLLSYSPSLLLEPQLLPRLFGLASCHMKQDSARGPHHDWPQRPETQTRSEVCASGTGLLHRPPHGYPVCRQALASRGEL